jgi:tetratricopeptide (TPR) repeat protein
MPDEERLHLARIFSKLGRCDPALIEYNKISPFKYNCDDFVNLGNCNYSIKKNELSLTFYENALKKCSDIQKSNDIKLKLIKIYIDKKDNPNAFKYIRELENQNMGLAYDRLAAIYYDKINDYPRVSLYASRVFKKDSTDMAIALLLVKSYENQYMKSKAKQIIQTINAQEDPKIQIKFGQYYYEQGDYEKSLEFFEKAYIVLLDSDILEKIAISAFNIENYDKAKDAAETYLKQNSSNECRKILYKIALLKGRHNEAAPYIEEILKTEPDLAYYKDLRECYKKLGKQEKLILVDERIALMDKTDIESRRRLIEAYLNQKRGQEALKLYFDLEKIEPLSISDYFKIIELLKDAKQQDKQIAYLAKIISYEPGNSNAHKLLGDIYFDQKKFDDAYLEYNKVSSLDFSRIDYLKNFCYVVIATKNKTEIIRIGNKAFESGITDPIILLSLAEQHFELSNYTKTLQIYSKVSRDKIDTTHLLKQAKCYEKLGNISPAISTYEEYVALNPNAKDEYLILAKLYLKADKKDQEIATYKSYLKKYKSDSLSLIVAEYEYNRGNYNDAIKYLSEASLGKNSKFLFMLGNSYFKTKKYDNAISVLTSLEKHAWFDKQWESFKLIAISYENLKNIEKAIKYYKTYSILELDSSLCFHMGELQEQLDVTLAKDIYEANTKKFPSDSRNFIKLGEINFKLKDYKKSKLNLEKAIAIGDTESIDIFLKLAHSYRQLNEKANEIKTYKQILIRDNKNFVANKFMGIYCYEEGQIREGLEYLETAKAQNYNDPDMLFILGQIYMKDGFSNEGMMFLQSAKKQEQKNIKLRLFIIESYKKAGKLKDAASEIESLLTIDRNFSNLDLYAKTLFELKNYQSAENVAIEMRKKEPRDIDLMMFLAQIKIEQTLYDEAIEYYKMISYVDSKHAPSICKRADAYLKYKKDVEAAKEYYFKAIKADSKYPMSYYGLAMIYKFSNNQQQYTESISKAYSLDSTNTVISEEYKKSK